MIQTYRIRCQIKPMTKDTDRLNDGGKPEIKVKDSKLHVYIDSGIVGQIVFEEDSLYYLVTPLFLQKAAKAELRIEGARNKRKPYMDATMVLHVDPSKNADMTEKINEEIKAMLGRQKYN